MRRFLLALLLCLAAAPAWGVVAFDSKNTAICDSATTTVSCTSTKSPTVGAGANRALAVLVVYSSGSGIAPTAYGATWNGTVVPLVGQSAYSIGAAGGTAVLCLAAPASGNNTLIVTPVGITVTELHVVSFSVTGADQTTPCQNYQGIMDQATSSTPTITVTSASGNIPFAIFANPNVVFGATAQTLLIEDSSIGPQFGYGANYGVGAATTALSFSLSGSSVNQISGADFKAAAGAASDPQSLPMTGFGN